MRKSKIPHINVDAFPLVDDHFSGVGHYTLGIVSGLDELAAEGKITYSLITPRYRASRLKKYNLYNYKSIVRNVFPSKIIRGFMKYHWPVPFDIFLGRGFYYFPSFLAWPTLFSKSSVVVHDVTYVAVPECVDKGNREYLSRVVPFSLNNSQNIISVSEFSKEEIAKFYKINKNNIFVAHPSVDKKHFYKRSKEEIHKVKSKYDIFSDKYILSVGNVEPRKNYNNLIDAYLKLPKNVTDKYPLVIVGAGGWNNKDVLEKIQKAKENGYRIINPKQFVEDDDMPALYSGAQFFVFVPIYEGFGMPPLESMACGTPVLASRAASVPEAAGKGAIYADPYDSDDIFKGLSKMISGTEKDRDQFNAAMNDHIDKFSWRDSANITASALTGLPVSYFEKDKEDV